ncbi:translation initiation factor IF-2 [Striga asiatica]|uniref:Translation initiation factor IF-2 n=1 Tax=Striga asiatica TaxID=4170 RepID=A0A5A7RHB5_STRAF|nr:translation initiation factor IF-2 [Striga asiatica]
MEGGGGKRRLGCRPINPKLINQLIQTLVRRPTLPNRPLSHLPQSLGPLPHLVVHHYFLHRRPHRLPPDPLDPHPLPLLAPHRYPHPKHLTHQLLVIKLLRKRRPRHHRHPRAHPFQNRCVTNPTTASCPKIAICGAHPLITSPLPLVRSSNPSGNGSSFPSCLTAHTKPWPDDSSPAAISRSCPRANVTMLPKHRYTTEFDFFESSHARQSRSSMSDSFPLRDSSLLLHSRRSGPTCQAFNPSTFL